jgi:hypothetical protein
MALLCSPDGMLFRQVARPARGGSYVELWNPRTEELVGTIPSGGGVLLDVRDHTLYLGSAPDERFILERMQYSIATPLARRTR